MSKDYVSRRRQNRHVPNASKRLVAIVTSFVCGYLVANVFDFTSLTTWVDHNFLKQKNDAPHVAVKEKAATTPKPKFEFYTLLSKDNRPPATVNRAHPATMPAKAETPTTTNPLPLEVTQSGIKSPSVAESKSLVTHSEPTSVSTKESYLIQVASFNKRQDAERVKASLVLSGFDVKVNSAVQQNITWYRVVIGPFGSRQEAEKAQATVARNEHMNGMIRRIAG